MGKCVWEVSRNKLDVVMQIVWGYLKLHDQDTWRITIESEKEPPEFLSIPKVLALGKATIKIEEN